MNDTYHKFLKKLAHFQVNNPLITIGLILLLTLAIYGGVSQVKTVASLEQMMPKTIEEIKSFNTLRDNNLGQDIIAIVLELDRDNTNPESIIDIRDKRIYDYTTQISKLIKQETDIRGVYSFSDIINLNNPKNSDESINQKLSQINYEKTIQNPQVKKQLEEFITSDYSKTIIIATTDISADDTRMNLLSKKIKQDIISAGTPPGIQIKYTGTPIIQQKLGELIGKDRTNTQWISTLLVFILTALIFGTFTSAVVPIIIVTISVNWLYGTMGYTSLPISTLAGGVAAMVIGIGIDFAIHIMNKFKLERKKGNTIKNSIELAVVETGTALTATSLTTITAFLAFLSGQMPEMGRFGILMAIGITYSLIFSIFGLPALLILEEKIIYAVKNKLKFGVEQELKLTKIHSKKKQTKIKR